MENKLTRIFLFLSLFFVGATLHSHWLAKHQSTQVSSATSSSVEKTNIQSQEDNFDVPSLADHTQENSEQALPDHAHQRNTIPESRLITVDTEVLKLKIDLKGGDIVSLSLPKHPIALETPEQGYQLLDTSSERFYIAQSGLLSKLGPDAPVQGRAIYTAKRRVFKYDQAKDSLTVPLYWESKTGVKVEKRYVFHPKQYLVEVNYIVNNNASKPWEGRMYGQLKRHYTKEKHKKGFMVTQTYTGAAVYTPDTPYKKLKFKEFSESPFSETIKGGWAAMVEHYFLSAWIPNAEQENTYYTKVDDGDHYLIGTMGKAVTVEPGQTKTISSQLYVGPEVTSVLKEISPGLDLTVDYGVLWPISQIIFWVMKFIHQIVGNWGLSIILVTVLIKAMFFKLSAASYRSMGNMRRLQPKIEQLKKRCADDRQALSQGMIALYKKERINPLGGCLPILVQIPVFIALYYVLLESVELRQAPFMLWIKDLAVKDPFYVLPILMGGTMFIQQRLNPASPDPVQAKIFMAMPVVFTVLFMNFPAGLVLYWLVNNTLSIIQQWVITRNIEKNAR